MASFSPERLDKIRKLRMARRLWKNTPLLAYKTMQDKYPEYTYEQFLNDLRIRKIKKKKRFVKNPLTRYGRYQKMVQLITQYNETKDPAFYLMAQKLRSIITRPYRLEIKKEAKAWEFTFPPEIPYKRIEQLSKDCNKCKTLQEAVDLCKNFTKTSGYGR